MSATAQGLCEFIDASPSPFHVCVTVAAAAAAPPGSPNCPRPTRGRGAGRFFVVRAGSLVAWAAGEPADGRFASSAATPTAPICGSSSIPTGSSSGWQVVALQPYGGAWLNSWLDRDLGISGRLSVRDGRTASTQRLVRIDDADPAGAAAGDPPRRGPQGR